MEPKFNVIIIRKGMGGEVGEAYSMKVEYGNEGDVFDTLEEALADKFDMEDIMYAEVDSITHVD